MMRLFLILSFIVGFIFCEEAISSNEVDSKDKDFQEHISLIVHEDLINKFFRNMGKIQGEGTSSIVDYTWSLLDPRVEIEEAGASFHGKVRIKGSNFRVTRDLEGSVSITYDKDINILNIKIDKADVILDVDIFGSNVVLGTLDVGKYFTKSLKLDGPRGIANEVEFMLPSGQMKKMKVEVASYDLKLQQDEVRVSTSLEFNEIN